MWSHEHVGETTASVAQVWAVLSDIDGWVEWDTSMQAIELHGPFRPGTAISMTPVGQEPIRSTIVEIVENERYADQTEFGGVTLRFSHTLKPRPDGGTQIVHRLDITGSAAEQTGPELGPGITEDFPEAMAGLIARAAGA